MNKIPFPKVEWRGVAAIRLGESLHNRTISRMWWNYRRTISAWNLSDHHHHHWCSADNRHNGGVEIQDICNNILQILGFTRLKRLQLNRSIFCWHSCPQLLSSPVFIRWSNIKWYFCCLSWGIFKKLATDPLQMQHRGNETSIKMLVYFQEFNLMKLRILKNNVDMLIKNTRYVYLHIFMLQRYKKFTNEYSTVQTKFSSSL